MTDPQIKPSLRCARKMHEMHQWWDMTQSEKLLAEFIAEHTGCDELLDVCKVCEQAIIELVASEHPRSINWGNLRTARGLARAIIAKVQSDKTTAE